MYMYGFAIAHMNKLGNQSIHFINCCYYKILNRNITFYYFHISTITRS